VLGDLIELFLHGERNFHRPPHEQGERGDQGFELDVELRAIAAADERHLDAHAVLRPAQQPRNLAAQKRGTLRAGMDGDARFVGIGDGCERLEGEMQTFLRAERVLEDMRGRRESRVHVAAAQPRVEREVGAFSSLEVLEVGEASGWAQLLVHGHARGHRFDFVVERGQLLVLRDDLLRCRLGHMRIARQHDRNRLADEADLVDSENRLVVECRPVVRVGNDHTDVVGGHDTMHAGKFLSGGGIDRSDAAMRQRAAKDLPIQHARQPHGVGIFSASGDLLARLEARQ
jgi:hypothetical protein